MAAKHKRSLNTITKEFGREHVKKKDAEAALKKGKDEFYEAANQALERGTLEQRTVQIPSSEDTQRYVDTHFPGWRIVGRAEEITLGGFDSLIIEEDPAFMPFVHFNDKDGKIYKRSAVPGSPYLDDEKLKAEDPDLWMAVSQPDPILLSVLDKFSEWSGGDIVRTLTRQFTQEIPRVLLPMDEIDPDHVNLLANYIVPGPIEIKMLAPRTPKPEEIEGDE